VKIEQLAAAVALKALRILEKKYHYRLPEDHIMDVVSMAASPKSLNTILAEEKEAPDGVE